MVRAFQAFCAQPPWSWQQLCIPAVSAVQGGQQKGTAAPGDKAAGLVLLAESPREGAQNSSGFSEVGPGLVMN